MKLDYIFVLLALVFVLSVGMVSAEDNSSHFQDVGNFTPIGPIEPIGTLHKVGYLIIDTDDLGDNYRFKVSFVSLNGTEFIGMPGTFYVMCENGTLSTVDGVSGEDTELIVTKGYNHYYIRFLANHFYYFDGEVSFNNTPHNDTPHNDTPIDNNHHKGIPMEHVGGSLFGLLLGLCILPVLRFRQY